MVVYVSGIRQQADDIVRLLEDEGFLVRLEALPGSGAAELRVLESEAEEARRFLMEKGF